MNNFSRALRDSLKYWKTLALATVCSLGVALLWGGNIGALFPVIQVTLGGGSLQQWIATEITASEQQIEQFSSTIERLHQQQAEAGSGERAQLASKIELLESRMRDEQSAIEKYRYAQPWIDRFVPHDPFQTVVAVIGILIFSTFLKHVLLLGNTVLVAKVSNSIIRSIRLRIFGKALELDRAGFAELGTSGFATQMTQTTNMLCGGIMNLFGGAIREPLKILVCLVGACLISWRLLVLSLLIAPVVVLLIAWLSKRIKSVCRRTIAKAECFNHVMLESLDSIQTVQAYGMEET